MREGILREYQRLLEEQRNSIRGSKQMPSARAPLRKTSVSGSAKVSG
jgi:hypothetical protein